MDTIKTAQTNTFYPNKAFRRFVWHVIIVVFLLFCGYKALVSYIDLKLVQIIYNAQPSSLHINDN
jgi:hypothetical protein